MRDILVIQLARFGDLLQTRRLVKSLAQSAVVHLLVDDALGEPATLVYPETVVHTLGHAASPDIDLFRRNRECFARLKEIDFSEVYVCNFSGVTDAVSRLFDENRLRGYRPGHASCGGLMRSPWARTGFYASRTRSASTLNLVDFWAYFHKSPSGPESVNPVAKAGGGGIGIAVAGRDKRRSLPAGLVAAIASVAFGLYDSPRLKLFGTSSEARQAGRIMREFSPRMLAATTDLCGKTGWRALIDEMTGLDLLLTPDTGLMHLAAFLGVPVLAFFLSSAWCHETGPYGKGHIVVQSCQPCSPCLESAQCTQGLKCLAPYKNPAFLRAVAMALTTGAKPTPPGGLQIWKTGFDALGLVLELVGGSDPWARDREYARLVLHEKLAPGHVRRDVLSDPLYIRALSLFEPESEWMLPPWRYC